MSDSSTKHASRRRSAAEKMALMHTLAFSAMRLSAGQLDDFTVRFEEALSAFSAQSPDREAAESARQAQQHLSRHRQTFQRLFNESLQQALLQAVQDVIKHDPYQMESGAMDLSLGTFGAMQKKVLIDNRSQALDAVNADALAVLGMRIADWLGMAAMNPAQHPFRAEVFLKAASEAWSKFDSNGASHEVVLGQMRPRIFLKLGPVLDALNQELLSRNVLPDAEADYRRIKAAPPTPPAPSLRDRLQRWLAPEGTTKLIGERAVLLMDKVFDRLLEEEALSAEGKTLLAEIRLPLQEAVLADSEVLFTREHSLRYMLDTMLIVALAGRTEADDPLYRVFARAVGLLQQAQRPGDLPVRITDELRMFMAQEDAGLDERLRDAMTEASREEAVAHMQELAAEDVRSRIETGEAPAFLEEFLQQHWSKVLAHAYTQRGHTPDLLPAALKTMDDLIWSAQIKPTPEERRELVERLPGLLSALNASLDALPWTGEEREQFFTALAERHAACMRAPAEMTPRYQLEMRMNVMQRASEHQLSRREREQKEEAIVELMPLIDSLKVGGWGRFVRNNGTKVNCRAVWISPARKRFVFIGLRGKLLFTLSEEGLAQSLHARRLRLVDPASLVEEALAVALKELGVA